MGEVFRSITCSSISELRTKKTLVLLILFSLGQNKLCFGIPHPIKWIRKRVFVNVLKHLVGIPLWEYLCGNTFVGVPLSEYLGRNTFIWGIRQICCKNLMPYFGTALTCSWHKANLWQELSAVLRNSPHLLMVTQKGELSNGDSHNLSEYLCRNTVVGTPLSEYNCRNTVVGIPLSEYHCRNTIVGNLSKKSICLVWFRELKTKHLAFTLDSWI